MKATPLKLQELRRNALKLPWSAPARNLYQSTIDGILVAITSDDQEELRQACRRLKFEFTEVDWQRENASYDNCAYGISVSVLNVLEWLIEKRMNCGAAQDSDARLEKIKACRKNAFELSGKRPIEPAGSLFQSTIEGLITVIATDVNPLALRRDSRRLGFELSEYVARAEYDMETSNDLSRQVVTDQCEAIKCFIDFLAEGECRDEERGENKKEVPVLGGEDVDLAEVSDLESNEEIVTHVGTHESKPPMSVLPTSSDTIGHDGINKKRASDASEREAGRSPKKPKLPTETSVVADIEGTQSGSLDGALQAPVSTTPVTLRDPVPAAPVTTAPEVPSASVASSHVNPPLASVTSSTPSPTSTLSNTVNDTVVSPAFSVETDATSAAASACTTPAMETPAIPILRLSLAGQPPSISVAAAAAAVKKSAAAAPSLLAAQITMTPQTPSPQKQPSIDSVFESASRPRAVRLRIREFEKLCTTDIKSGKRELPNTLIDKANEIQKVARKLEVNQSEIQNITAELAKMCGHTVTMLQRRIEKERQCSSGTLEPSPAAQVAAASQFLSTPDARNSSLLSGQNTTARGPATPQQTPVVPSAATTAAASRTSLPSPTNRSAASTSAPVAPTTAPTTGSPWKEAKRSYRQYLVNDHGDMLRELLDFPGIREPIEIYKMTLIKMCPRLGDAAFLYMNFKDNYRMAFAFKTLVELGNCTLKDKPLHFLAYLDHVVRHFFGENGRLDRLVHHFACTEMHKVSMERIRNLPEYVSICQRITQRESELVKRAQRILMTGGYIPQTTTALPRFAHAVVDHEETVATENSSQDENTSENEDSSPWSNAFKCSCCGQLFLRRILLQKHLAKMHTSRLDDGEPNYTECRVKLRFKCDICGKSFLYRQYLLIHGRCHSGDFPKQCFSCGTGYNSQRELERHFKRHKMGIIRPRGWLLCLRSGCTHRFKTRKALGLHRLRCGHRRARAVQPGVYTVPSTPATRPAAPVNADPIVTGFVAAIGVATATSTTVPAAPATTVPIATNAIPAAAAASTLTTDREARPFKCECGKNFRTRVHLSVHKKRHSGKFTDRCDECGTGYYTRNEFERHMNYHKKGTVRVRCPHCRAWFRSQQTLAIHKIKEHSAEVMQPPSATATTAASASVAHRVASAGPSSSATAHSVISPSGDQTKGESARLRETENTPPEMLTDDDLLYMEQ